MFDIAFSEIVIIAVVALVIIGPERLPKAARTLGHLFGRLQRYVNDVKSDINREIELDELRKLQKEVQSAAQDLKSSVESAASGVQSEVRSVEAQLNAGATETAAGADPETARLMMDPAPLGTAAGASASTASPDALPVEAARQPSLPGFDRI